MTFSLKLFGGASIEGPDGRLSGGATQRHRLALLTLLATVYPRGISRDRLLAYLWPESDAEHARNLLNQAVHAVRKSLDGNAVLSVGDELRLNAEIVDADVTAFQNALATGDAERAVAIYEGPFLGGFFLSAAPDFERWVEGERERFRRDFVDALETLARQATTGGDPASAVGWWRRLTAEEPYSSRVTLGLMNALEAAGDRAGAIRYAQVHTALLREELSAEPDPEVTDLAERLRLEPTPRINGSESRVQDLPAELGDAPPGETQAMIDRLDALSAPVAVTEASTDPVYPWATRVRRQRKLQLGMGLGALTVLSLATILTVPVSNARGDINSIAVLPFVNMSGDADDEYFSDGMTEELIHALTNVDGLRVTARTSAFQFKGKNIDVRDVGDQLGVESVLEGSVRKSGNQLRITVQLVNTRDGSHLWSRTYDRDLEDVLAVQEEIARSIAATLRIGSADAMPLIAHHPDDREAFELYLKGRHAWNQRTRASVMRAIDYFEQAIEREPDYALAYSGLAAGYLSLDDYAGLSEDEWDSRVRAAAMTAIALEPGLAEPEAILAFWYLDTWQWERAEIAFHRAIELNPYHPTTYQWYSNYLKATARLAEALSATLRAQELDPLSPVIGFNVVGAFILLGDFENAIREARSLIELHPNSFLGYDALGRAYVEAGQPERAIAPLERAVDLGGGGRGLTLAHLARAYSLAGREAEARTVLARLESEYGSSRHGGIAIASVHMSLGDHARALEWLEKHYRMKRGNLPYIRTWPVFRPLHDDPRFTSLVRGMGFDPPAPATSTSLLN